MAMNEITTSSEKSVDSVSASGLNLNVIQVPTIEIPEDVAMNEKGYVVFSLSTKEGPINVQAFWHRLECRGTAAALISGGLCRPEWFPGLPGNNKSRQMVCFGSDGHWLRLGRHTGKKEPSPSITVARISARTFMVEVPATSEQSSRLESFFEQREKLWADERFQRQKNERLAARQVMAPEVAHRFYCGVIESAISWIHKNMEGTTCVYTPASANRIDLALEGVRRAFVDGCVVQMAPKYRRDGNLIHFPQPSAKEPCSCNPLD